jgi:hypothetical protein
MNPKGQKRIKKSAELVLLALIIPLSLVGPRWAMAQENPKVTPAPEAVACEAQPGFKNLDAITILVENEAAEQEEIIQALKTSARPVPAPPAVKAKEVKALMRDFFLRYVPRLKVKVIPGEFQPRVSALRGSHSLLQARLEVIQRAGEVWEQRVDLFFFRRVTVDRTRERLFSVIWQGPAIVQSKKPEQLPKNVKKNLVILLREFECRYRKAGNR